MPLSVKYNGIDITEYITVLEGFTIHGGADWNPTYKEYSAINGADFLETKYKIKEIPMPFAIKDGIWEKYDGLSDALNVSEPKELIFGNKPDRVYYAIPKGDFDFDELNKTSGVGTITWIIPDGLAHSATEKTFEASMNADGILEAEIINDGSESVPISYEITHNHENGYIGIISEDGVIQYGSVSEQDTEDKHSEVLLKYSKATDFGAMTSGKGILASNDNFPMNGTLGAYDAGLALKDAGSGSGWHGGARQVTLPADVNGETGATNFKAVVNVQFETSKISETGLLEFVIGDTDGNHLASIHIVKSSSSDSRCSAIFQVQAVEKGRVQYEPNSASVTNSKNGQMYIQKSGELFDFCFGGKTYSYRAPEAKDKKALTITVFLGKYGTNTTVNTMLFKSMSFQKNNVEYTVDIPNRYQDGDIITVDGDTTKMYVNGIPMLGDEVKGSRYFHAKPGTTKVQFYVSEFCTPLPKIAARIREAWL